MNLLQKVCIDVHSVCCETGSLREIYDESQCHLFVALVVSGLNRILDGLFQDKI